VRHQTITPIAAGISHSGTVVFWQPFDFDEICTIAIKEGGYCSRVTNTAVMGSGSQPIGYGTRCFLVAAVAAFFDGDGADFIEVKGLPENDGAAMADACGNWGDGLMAHIGPYSAQTYNTSYADVNGESVEVLRRKTVWPPEKAE
jgi:hypothetical protein